MKKGNTYLYKSGKNYYINITNRCSNRCEFCIRTGGDFGKYNLWLEKEPEADEIIKLIDEVLQREEIAEEFVFCGYGEPLYRLDVIIKVSDYLHSKGKKTRLNTNGQAKLIAGEGVAEKLQGKIDTINISLNASTKEKYQQECHSIFGEDAYDELLKFAKECKKHIKRVILSVVDVIGAEEIEKCKTIAAEAGVELRVREYIES